MRSWTAQSSSAAVVRLIDDGQGGRTARAVCSSRFGRPHYCPTASPGPASGYPRGRPSHSHPPQLPSTAVLSPPALLLTTATLYVLLQPLKSLLHLAQRDPRPAPDLVRRQVRARVNQRGPERARSRHAGLLGGDLGGDVVGQDPADGPDERGGGAEGVAGGGGEGGDGAAGGQTRESQSKAIEGEGLTVNEGELASWPCIRCR